MDGGFTQTTVMWSSQPFTIDGYDLPGRYLADGRDPTDKTALKLMRVYQTKHPTKGIVGGNTVGEDEEGAQPFLFRFSKFLHFNPTICSTDNGTNGDDDDFYQQMLYMMLAGIFDLPKMFTNTGLDSLCQFLLSFLESILAHFYLLRQIHLSSFVNLHNLYDCPRVI